MTGSLFSFYLYRKRINFLKRERSAKRKQKKQRNGRGQRIPPKNIRPKQTSQKPYKESIPIPLEILKRYTLEDAIF